MDYDIFISHASEDKDSVARPLALALKHLGYSIWYDEFTLKLGDSLRRSIDAGLAKSRFGVVVLSPAFLQKNWPQYELDGLVQRENIHGQKVILPVWHNVDHMAVATYSPSLADRVAVSSAVGINSIADKIAAVLEPTYASQIKKPLTDSSTSRTEGNAILQWRQELPVSYPNYSTKEVTDPGRVELVLQHNKKSILDRGGGLVGCLAVWGTFIGCMAAVIFICGVATELITVERFGFFSYILSPAVFLLGFIVPLYLLQKGLEKIYE